jgi:hypothetical protein
VINCQFIFKLGVYDDDFRAVEMWQTADGSVVNASYGDGRLPHVTRPPES